MLGVAVSAGSATASDADAFKEAAPKLSMLGTALLCITWGEPRGRLPAWERDPLWIRLLDAVRRREPVDVPDAVPAIISRIPGRPDFHPIEFDPKTFESPYRSEQSPEGADSPAASAFRIALGELLKDRGGVPRRAPPPKYVDIVQLRTTVATALDPKTTVAAPFRHNLHLQPRLQWTPADPLEPILAAPEFDQPMFIPLRNISQDWMLPGIDRIPQNSVVLLQTNRRFVESYMVGLSHEFSRELVWNEYPTDQRGTYFRQFWDPAPFVDTGAGVNREALYDIEKIDRWGASGLGVNRPQTGILPEGEEQLVLLVRGELLRRYPMSTIYLTSAGLDGPSDNDPEYHPAFRGTLLPDITFLGFGVGLAEVAAPGRTWSFVVQEHAAEQRFGFEDNPSPGSVSWTDLGVPPGGSIDVGSARALAGSAAAIAQRALWLPVRIVIPLAFLLPARL
jgi:hypothetical protein